MILLSDSLNSGAIAGIIVMAACVCAFGYVIWESTHMKNKKK
jgi:tetrahydrodipicolinate N-succinyltransferase